MWRQPASCQRNLGQRDKLSAAGFSHYRLTEVADPRRPVNGNSPGQEHFPIGARRWRMIGVCFRTRSFTFVYITAEWNIGMFSTCILPVRMKFIAVLTILLFLPSISLAAIELKKLKFIYHDQSPYRDLALKVYGLNWGKSGSNRKIGYADIEVGAFDINDDGVEEVFLKFNFGCGNYAGCEILVYNIKACLFGYHPHPLYVVCLLGLQARAGAGALRRRSG